MKPRLIALGAMVTSLVGAAVAACGSEDGSVFIEPGKDSGSEANTSSGNSGFVPGDGGGGNDEGGSSGGSCSTAGRSCGDAGVCAGGECCSPQQACDTTCCGTGTVCSFQKCVAPGAKCFDSSECGSTEYCEFSLGETTTSPPDASCVGSNDRTGKCLPKPPECPSGTTPPADGPITCLQKCELPPPAASFNVTLKAGWGGKLTAPANTNVMMAPIVMQLDDDDCDGKVTERDIPEIIFSTFTNGNYNADGQLHAVSLKNGVFVDKWTVPNATTTTVVHPTKQIAAGNFDGKPGNEVVACGADGKAYAFNGVDGSLLWATKSAITCFMPSLADLEGDGKVEVIVEGGILDGATGALKHAFESVLDGPFVVSDIDSDGQLDIVTYARGYNALGIKFVDTGKTTTPRFANTGDWKGPWSAVADFTGDGKPEVIAVDNETHTVHMWRFDGAKAGKFEIIRPPVDMNALFDAANTCKTGSWGELHGGGPPTIGDFDKDGVPDVALAGGIGYVVFDGKKLRDPAITGKNAILWSNVTTDCSSASTGSTLFDFDGDGKAEVVYSDEKRIRVYEGATGKELASFCNTTATLSEFPIVADVDNDGQADIIAVSNQMGQACDDGTHQAGVRVFGPATGNWVRTRRVWNEHAYHVSNVAEDGTIPKPELANWTVNGLNNFRQNKQPGSEFAAPNLVASLTPLCAPAGAGVTITIRNVGEAAVPKGVVIGVYGGTTKLGSVTTSRQLYPAEAEPIDFVFPGNAPASVNVKIDDGAPAHPSWTECRTDDNAASMTVSSCGSGVK